MEPDLLKKASHILLTADYVHYQLSGVAANERTLASTSQMLQLDGAWWPLALQSTGHDRLIETVRGGGYRLLPRLPQDAT